MQNATLLIDSIAKFNATKIHFDQRLVFFYLMFRLLFGLSFLSHMN